MDNGSTAVLQRVNVRVGPGHKSEDVYSKVLEENHGRDKGNTKPHHRRVQKNEPVADKRQLLKCGMCKDVFFSIHDISNHLKHHHIVIQAFDCGICMKFFPFHDELESHLLDDHLQSDTGPTPICKVSQINVGEIENFMKNSDMRESVELKCPLCGCVYNKLAQYQDHMSASHRGKAWDKDGLCSAILKVTTVKKASVKPVIKDIPNEQVPGKIYTCNRCDQKVFGREPMKRHAATHHDSEIIQCATCFEFFITEASYLKHKKQKHVSLLNLNVKQNRHGDIIGASLDDILKANDCLSQSCCEPSKEKIKKPSVDDMVYIDLDTKCTVTVEKIPDKVKKKDVQPKKSVEKEKVESRPDWRTHKRERSDDSLPDPDNPMYNLILLSKSAVREQKRLAVETDPADKDNTKTNDKGGCEATQKTDPKRTIVRKMTCKEVLPEKKEPVLAANSDETTARFFLSIFHAMTGLAALALYQLQRNIAV